MSTLGQPGFVPSNTVGQSGISANNIGSLGSGVLQTITEGVGGTVSNVFYYDQSVASYQLPSVQRSHGDDQRTLNITNFGARSTVTLPRKWFNYGPAAFRFELPIDYAWTGCEYVANTYDGKITYDSTTVLPGQGADLPGHIALTVSGTRRANEVKQANANRFFFESSGCSTMLPTSFQSGGMGFAFVQQIELNMGGGGLIQFDRNANWAAIMASCPFLQQRKDLMRMAGGGLCLDTDEEAKTMPVRWGLKNWCNSAGNTNAYHVEVLNNTNRNEADGNNLSKIQSITTNTYVKKKMVPVMWDVLVPIKTPDTNFMYSLERRKPLDTSCLASDFQITFSLSNFNEWSDTGKGFPNAPVYYGQYDQFASTNALVYTKIMTENNALGGTIGLLAPFTGVAPTGYSSIEQTQNIPPVHGGELGAPLYVSLAFSLAPRYYAAVAADVGEQNAQTGYLGNVIHCNPAVHTNHYRVALGPVMKLNAHYNAASITPWSFSGVGGVSLADIAGRPRYPRFLSKAGAGVDEIYRSNQRPAETVNGSITYPNKFSSIQYINSSLKLTNPALGAYNALRSAKESVLYYPMQYFYTQVYRVTTNPFQGLTNLTYATVAEYESRLSDLTSQSNKITQLIQMPANPCTALLLMIFREKDRQTNIQGKRNSYNPVLFWNALNPIRCDLKDSGNTLFSYHNNIDFEYYSLMDRPDALKVPFRGGHVKVMPKNLYGNRYLCQSAGNLGGVYGFGPNDPATFVATDPYTVGAAKFAVPAPFWYTSGTDALGPVYGLGVQGVIQGDAQSSHPADSVNAFPADDLCDSVCVRNGLRGANSSPCHTTDWYEASILEFPFVMAEPFTSEKIVQQTPSFARTQLQLDFWIDPFLKPDNGFDDMYDQTYGLTRAAPSGIPTVGFGGGGSLTQTTPRFRGVAAYFPNGPVTSIPDCLSSGGNDPLSSRLGFRDTVASGAPGTGPYAALSGVQEYADGFDFSTANSWNINNGNLSVHVIFAQNHVWTISPLRTSILQARG